MSCNARKSAERRRKRWAYPPEMMNVLFSILIALPKPKHANFTVDLYRGFVFPLQHQIAVIFIRPALGDT